MMNLAGVLAPIPTPFDDDGAIDFRRFRRALIHWADTPLRGVVVLGSNGEAVLLDDDESDRVVAAARDEVPSSRLFIVGTGRESTRATIQAAARAASMGANAVLVRTPGFFKTQMTAEAFMRHYSAVADASPVPVLLYNFTAVTGVTVPVEAVARLANHPNIVGMKESNGDIERLAALVAVAHEDFEVLAGSASTFCEALLAGASGGILALSAVIPETCVRVFELTTAGRIDEARSLQRQLTPLAKLVGATYGVPGLKAALKLVECDVGVPRSPLAPVGAEAVATIADALALVAEVHGHTTS